MEAKLQRQKDALLKRLGWTKPHCDEECRKKICKDCADRWLPPGATFFRRAKVIRGPWESLDDMQCVLLKLPANDLIDFQIELDARIESNRAHWTTVKPLMMWDVLVLILKLERV